MKPTARLLEIVLCAPAILGVAVAAANAADRINLQPGNWEISITNEMEGMASMSMPPMTVTHCIKSEEVKDPRSFVDAMQKRNGKCTLSELKQEGDKWSWNFACENGPSGTTEYLFGGTSYEATSKISVPAKDKHGAMKMTQHIKGKRLGDC
jgi:hypothetical protein